MKMDDSSNAAHSSRKCDLTSFKAIDAGGSQSSFLWTIKYFNNYPLENNLTFTSEIETKDGSKWLLKLERDDNFKFSLILVCSSKDVLASVTISALDGHFNKQHETSSITLFRNKSDVKLTVFLMTIESCQSLLFNNPHLVLEGAITIQGEEFYQWPVFSEPVALFHDLETLLENAPSHDFTIEVKNKKFPCHKAILASRSQYFDTLFKSEMKEQKEKRLVLKDTDPNIFHKVLQFIYTDKTEVTEEDVVPLLEAAEKFLLDKLKSICETKLHSLFSLYNAYNIFTLASTFNLLTLKKRALRVLATFTHHIRKKQNLHFLHQISSGECEMEDVEITEPSEETSLEITNESNIEPSDIYLDRRETFLRSISMGPYLPPVDIWCTTENSTILNHTWRVRGMGNALQSNLDNMCWSQKYEDKEKKLIWKGKIRIESKVKIENQECRSEFGEVRFNGVGSAIFLNSQLIGFENSRPSPVHRLRDNKECQKRYLVLTMEFMSYSEPTVDIDYRVSFVLDKEMESDITSGFHSFKLGESFEVLRFEEDCIPVLLQNGDLALNCKYMVRKSFTHSATTINVEDGDLKDSLKTLMKDEMYTNVTITVNGVEFQSHKSILECRWPFLIQILRDSPEGNEVILEGIDTHMFEKILTCIYTDEFCINEKKAKDILPVAHKFQIMPVIRKCEDQLISSLTSKNALEMFKIANSYGTTQFQKACKQFIAKYLAEIIHIDDSNELFNAADFFDCLNEPEIEETNS